MQRSKRPSRGADTADQVASLAGSRRRASPGEGQEVWGAENVDGVAAGRLVNVLWVAATGLVLAGILVPSNVNNGAVLWPFIAIGVAIFGADLLRQVRQADSLEHLRAVGVRTNGEVLGWTSTESGWEARYWYRVGDRMYEGSMTNTSSVKPISPDEGDRVLLGYDPKRPRLRIWLSPVRTEEPAAHLGRRVPRDPVAGGRPVGQVARRRRQWGR